MIDDVWWIFSEGKPPFKHLGNLHPVHAKGLEKPWAYCTDRDQWCWFNEYERNWQGGWGQVQRKALIPNEYLIQLLLVKS